ncbi:hypothetical protein AB0M50_38885 [Nonomuraea fuscirosea]|uniref:hypothetical protein n=1 Tax=Nonomuraea fuscirosea TaxID=1291556 RepID=UPI00341ADB72
MLLQLAQQAVALALWNIEEVANGPDASGSGPVGLPVRLGTALPDTTPFRSVVSFAGWQGALWRRRVISRTTQLQRFDHIARLRHVGAALQEHQLTLSERPYYQAARILDDKDRPDHHHRLLGAVERLRRLCLLAVVVCLDTVQCSELGRHGQLKSTVDRLDHYNIIQL